MGRIALLSQTPATPFQKNAIESPNQGYGTRAAMKKAAGRATNLEHFYLAEPNRAGNFLFLNGDFSKELAIDTIESIYMLADKTPAFSGALVRQFSGFALPEWGDADLSIVLPIYDRLGIGAVQLLGDYLVSDQIDQGNLHLEGPAKLIQSGSFESILSSTGSLTRLPSVSTNLTEGDIKVAFSKPHDLSVNDIFGLFNPSNGSFHGGREYYMAGEMCEVIAVEDNIVTVKRPLVESYTTAEIDLYALNAKSPSFSNIEFETTTAFAANYNICRDIHIDNPKGTSRATRQVQFYRCYNFVINSPFMNSMGAGGSTDYCIVVANSQHGRIMGGNIYGTRHPIAIGGGKGLMAVPCDDIKIIGSTLSNNQTVDCADFHGNARNSEYINCEINGSIKFGGKNNGYRGCKVGTNGNGVCLNASEILGGKHYAIDCDFSTFKDPITASRGIFDIGGNANSVVNANTVEDTSFLIRGGSLKGRNFSKSTNLIRCFNRGFRKKLNFSITDMIFDLDSPVSVLVTRIVSGTANSDFMIVDRLVNLPTGSRLAIHSGTINYLNVPQRMQTQSGSKTLSAKMGKNNTTGKYTNFDYQYPRSPVVNVNASLRTVIYNSNRPVFGHADIVESDRARFSIHSTDGTNWPETADASVHWVAGINEV